MSPAISISGIHEVPPQGARRYVGHFTTAGVGEGPFLSNPYPDEFRNSPGAESQRSLLQSFASADEELYNRRKYGDLRAETLVEFA